MVIDVECHHDFGNWRIEAVQATVDYIANGALDYNVQNI